MSKAEYLGISQSDSANRFLVNSDLCISRVSNMLCRLKFLEDVWLLGCSQLTSLIQYVVFAGLFFNPMKKSLLVCAEETS